MANPLNNLSKYPRRPFREKGLSSLQRSVPTVHKNEIPNLRELDISLSDLEFNDLIDDVTTDMASKNLSKYSSGLINTLKSEKNLSSRSDSRQYQPLSKDYEIISKLLSTIKALEMSNRYHEKEIREKNLRIKVLEEKCILYKTAQEIKNVDIERFKEIENEYAMLKNKIAEMENFLSDYGLIWVGDKSFQSESPSQDMTPIYSPSILSNQRSFVVNYDKIFKIIAELNLMMNSDETKIAMTAPQRVELKRQQAVPITFYSNGICFYNGPFRPFSEESTRQVILDLTDGYFPSELEGMYPTGVPIDAVDRRNIMYDAKPIKVFQGCGQTLGGSSTVSKLTGMESADTERECQNFNQPYTSVLTSDASTQMTMEQFLNKLPQSTISKDGKILAIRNSIREIIEKKPVAPLIGSVTSDNIVNDAASCSSSEIAKIKIRSLNGDRFYHVTVNRNDPVSVLYQKFFELSRLENGDNYVLVISYPSRRVLSELNQTIEECQLIPTASLHIEALSSASERH